MKKTRILNGIIAATVLFIWGHSCMNGDLSGEESSRLFAVLAPVLRKIFGEAATELFLRKIAHFTEYALLGAELSVRAAQGGTEGLRRDSLRDFSKRLLFCLLVCFLDETIQTFVPGRTGLIRDMWIDLAGAFTGSLLVTALLSFWAKRKK